METPHDSLRRAGMVVLDDGKIDAYGAETLHIEGFHKKPA
jgi:hypothetical protein